MLTFFKQLRVDLNKHLQGIIDHAVNSPIASPTTSASSVILSSNARSRSSPVPVRSRVGKQGREDEREDDLDVFAHQGNDIRVVPVIQSSFGDLSAYRGTKCMISLDPCYTTTREPGTDLEVLTVDTPRQLLEQRFHDLLKLLRFHDIQNLFDLVQEHDLLGRIDFGPIPQETHHDLFRQRSVLFQELDDTVGELRVVERQRLGLVQGDEDPREESLVFLLEREGEPVDDGPEYLEELGDPVVSLGLVNELEKDVVDGSTNESSEVEEFSINPV